MATQSPVFTLLAGDICYADPDGSGLPADDSAIPNATPAGKNKYNPYVWDVFLNQIEPQAAFTPWMFATGNHDMEPLYGNTEFLGGSPNHGYGGHAKRLDLPANGPHTCPAVYRFGYGNVGVISVDANDLSYEIQTNTGYSQVRYDDYAFIAVDVVPGRHGERTTFTVRTLADALPGSGKPYTEIDKITFERTAGRSRIRTIERP
ncbi:hypothetical protein [Actinoplanes subtropicus]|uniref:hypothetical protein n=1 Tax=Actinoplanes subtropicus TaxID=543632 RepID=UPI0004C45D64|nr:hypothetical protein [Actinoplanes subtropicus]